MIYWVISGVNGIGYIPDVIELEYVATVGTVSSVKLVYGKKG